MASLRDTLVRLSASLRRSTIERDLDDEVQFHIDKLTRAPVFWAVRTMSDVV